MKPLLKITQKYAVIVGLVIAFSLWAGLSGEEFPGEVESLFSAVVEKMAEVLFSSVPDALAAIWAFFAAVPLVIVILAGGALYFTLKFDFINLRGFRHAIDVVRGKYDNPGDPGEVSHFQALSSALSATVGLGNIAGVAVAVTLGGPGAIFWMVLAGLFGMTSKFAECTLGQMYRQVDEKGHVRGGPMVYLRDGLADRGWPNLGKYLSVAFAILCIGGSFGGGNMFQANQAFQQITNVPGLSTVFSGAAAQGTVELRAVAPVEIEARKHLVRFVRPGTPKDLVEPGDPAPAADDTPELVPTRVFAPMAPLAIGLDDWQRDQAGFWKVEIPVRAIKSGLDYNVAPGAVTQIEIGQVAERQVNYVEPEGLTVTNPAPIGGGEDDRGWLFGIILALMVGVVIVGGIKSIGRVAEKVVPLMCGLYLAAGTFIILTHLTLVPEAMITIFREAFNPMAGLGGAIGVFIQGVRRAAFSSEAGVGSAAIAHSAAKTDEPVREGIVALLEPFIDTVVVCLMTGFVIVITGVYREDHAAFGLEGVLLTSAAFETAISWFPQVLAVAVFLFAFSTMISWSYYGERCWTFLFGDDQSMTYRIIFLFFVWLGCVSQLQAIIDFSDLMILSMAFPNIIGVIILSPKIKEALERYWAKYKAGEFKTFE